MKQITETYLDGERKYYLHTHTHNGYSVRQWFIRPGFNPRSSHTKDFKNGTLLIFTQPLRLGRIWHKVNF